MLSIYIFANFYTSEFWFNKNHKHENICLLHFHVFFYPDFFFIVLILSEGGEELVLPDAVSFRDNRPPEGIASPGSAKAPFLPASPPPPVTPPVPSPRSEFKINAGSASPLPPPTAVLRSASPASRSLSKNTSQDSDNEEDELQGQTVVLHSGLTIDCASAAYGPRSADDPETEDEFGYTSMKVTVIINKRTVFRIRIRIQSDPWIRIRIRNLNTDPDPDPGGQK